MDSNERVVTLRPRTVATVSGILIGIAAALWVVWIARQVITWILIALFLALALDPAVRWVQRRGVHRRGASAGVVYVIVLLAIAGLAAIFVPTLVSQVNKFVDAIPGYVRDLTHGRGPFGFLETKYHIVERVRSSVNGRGGGNFAGGASAVLDITRSVVTFVAGVITIAFMTFFMLLEGPRWVDRGYALMRPESERRWRRVGHDVYRIIGGYVSGNLAISAIAASSSTIVLVACGVPFPLALGLLVFILDLIPLAGATLAAVVLALVAFSHSTTAGIVVVGFFILYQQLENHLLQPLVYGRTVQISPLLALISVLIGAEVAGVLGALGAIPIAGSAQVLLADWRRQRTAEREAVVADGAGAGVPVVTPPP
jgi:predicted PurR-regulated permease PerM